MDERWTEIMHALRARFSPDADIVEVEAYLSSQGLDRRQIGEVLSLYYAHHAPSSSATAPEVGIGDPIAFAGVRVQGPHERGRFSGEAWGYLLTLYASGMVGRADFERLIERALYQMDGRIGLDEMRMIAEEVGLDSPPTPGHQTLAH